MNLTQIEDFTFILLRLKYNKLKISGQKVVGDSGSLGWINVLKKKKKSAHPAQIANVIESKFIIIL